MPLVNSFWTEIPEATIRDIAADPNFADLLDWLELNKPFVPALTELKWGNGHNFISIPEAEINSVAASVSGIVSNALVEAGRRAMTPEEADDLVRTVRGSLRGRVVDGTVNGDLVLRAGDAGLALTLTHGHFFASLQGRLDTALFDVQATAVDKDAAKTIIVIDILIEAVGAVLGALGIAVPKADMLKIVNKIASKLKSPAFKAAFTALVNAIKANNSAAIVQAMQALIADGTIVAMLSAWLDDLSFWDFVTIIGTFAAYILAALTTGGATTAVKIGLAIANLLAIANKFQLLEDL